MTDAVQWYADRPWIAVNRLARDIFYCVVDDVVTGQCIKIAHATAYECLENEDVALQGEPGIIREVGIEQFVPFLKGDKHGSAIDGLIEVKLIEGTVLCQSVVVAPAKERAYLAEVVDERVLATWLGRSLLWCGLKQLRIIVAIDMLVLHILPDVVKHRLVNVIYI